MTTEFVENLILPEKKALEEEKLKQEEKYKWAVVDGVKEQVIFPIVLSCSKVRVPLNFCLSFRLVIQELSRLGSSEAVESIQVYFPYL